RSDPRRQGQGQGRRRPPRQEHRGREGPPELSFHPSLQEQWARPSGDKPAAPPAFWGAAAVGVGSALSARPFSGEPQAFSPQAPVRGGFMFRGAASTAPPQPAIPETHPPSSARIGAKLRR